MSHAPVAARGKASFIVGVLGLFVALYAIVVMGSIPIFTIGIVLFCSGCISRMLNTDVIDVFMFSLIGIAALMFVLYQVDTRFLQKGAHHEKATPTTESAPQH